jgi:hypothetical protein
MEQNDERRILGQMVRFQNQAAVRINNDCVNRRVIALGGISPRNQGQEKEKKRLFHVPLLDIRSNPQTQAPTQRTVISKRKLSTSPGVKQDGWDCSKSRKQKPRRRFVRWNQSLRRSPN